MIKNIQNDKLIKNKSGFTFVEIMMAASLGAVIMFFTVTYFNKKNQEISKTQDSIEKTLDGLNFEERIRKDLFETKYSFNTLLVKDDNDQLFFDYLGEGKCTIKCARTLTLTFPKKANDYSKEIYFITKDSSSSIEQLMRPEDAYAYSNTKSDTDANLKFYSLNKDNNLSSKPYTPWEITKLNPSRLMLIYAPTMIFQNSADIGVTPGRMIQFMGWLNDSNFTGKLIPEKIATSKGNLFYDKDIRTGLPINDEDTLLKKIPYKSGLGVFVMVAPVKVIRLRIQAVKENGKLIGKLFRDELIAGNKYNQMVIATGISQVVFSRDSISNSSINLKVTYVK